MTLRILTGQKTSCQLFLQKRLPQFSFSHQRIAYSRTLFSEEEISREKALEEKIFGKKVAQALNTDTKGGTAHAQNDPKTHSQTLLYYSLMFFAIGASVVQLWASFRAPPFFQVPMWIVDEADCGRWLLLQACYGQKFVKKLYAEFEALRQNEPLLTFSLFLHDNHPRIFAGQKYSELKSIQATGFAAKNCTKQRLMEMLSVNSSSSPPTEKIDKVVSIVLKHYPQALHSSTVSNTI